MVVCDLDFVGITVLPAEAHPVLIIETNAILPGSVAAEPLQTVPWRHP
jgi:hypothetical protein